MELILFMELHSINAIISAAILDLRLASSEKCHGKEGRFDKNKKAGIIYVELSKPRCQHIHGL